MADCISFDAAVAFDADVSFDCGAGGVEVAAHGGLGRRGPYRVPLVNDDDEVLLLSV